MEKQARRLWAARIVDLHRALDASDVELDIAYENGNAAELAIIHDRMKSLRSQIKILSRRLYKLAGDDPIMVRTGGAMWMIKVEPEQRHYWPVIRRLAEVAEY